MASGVILKKGPEITEKYGLKSINKESLVAAAFSLGSALWQGSEEWYAWVSSCRWTPNKKYGMEQHVDETYQLAFTRFGVVVMRNWEEIFTPSKQPIIKRPVLIYDYDAFCFLFCDAANFVRKTQAWTIFSGIFGVQAPPIAEPAPKGKFAKLDGYMALHLAADSEGEPIRPRFYNRTIEDPDLGTFTFDRRLESYRGEVAWEGKPVRLYIFDGHEALKLAYALLERQKVWNRRMRDFAVQELFDAAETGMSRKQFKDCMTLQSITVNPNGTFDFSFDVGEDDMLCQVCGSLTEGPIRGEWQCQ